MKSLTPGLEPAELKNYALDSSSSATMLARRKILNTENNNKTYSSYFQKNETNVLIKIIQLKRSNKNAIRWGNGLKKK